MAVSQEPLLGKDADEGVEEGRGREKPENWAEGIRE